ncbi:oligosaccharide flippase family protein [Pseudoalteromonas sp. Angola-30]|uniref:oligosaccharide flippase family protein n=1 Tax=Pseudoalteromonas sp. Angola-30 TaxID=3025341 RepID=UPI002358FDF6|nr:oligosaccharide flippase family protein [Pseudoalteromonas sp. Angola-30]MDC9524630.1 oligosaccharide flippase family protein [Pseudoalteromonas sp. Angola-30]
MNKDIRKVLENGFSLLVLQSGNYIVPLVLTPYLIIKLGVGAFGTLSFIIAINTFFRVFVSYGFDFTATKAVAESSNDLRILGKIFTDVIFAKSLLCIISFIILCTLIFTVEQFTENKLLLLSYFILVIADVFFPAWLFQGLQNMKVITFLKLFSKFTFVGLVLVYVNSPEDILYIPLIEASISIIISLASIIIAVRMFKLKLYSLSLKRSLDLLISARHVFLSKGAVLFYTSLNTVILGLMFSNVIVGYYSIAEKVYMASRELFRPFIQAVFPYLAGFRKRSYTSFKKYVQYSFLTLMLLLSIFSGLLFIFGEALLIFLIEGPVSESLPILKVFSMTLLFAIGGFLSSILILEEKGSVLTKVTFTTVVVNLILVYPMLLFFGAIGLAYCFFIVQLVHFIIQIYVNREILKRVH